MWEVHKCTQCSAPPPGKVVSAQTKGELEVPEAVGGGWRVHGGMLLMETDDGDLKMLLKSEYGGYLSHWSEAL